MVARGHANATRFVLVLALAVAGCGGGDDDTAGDVVLEDVEGGSTEEEATSTTAAEADEVEACLDRAGLSLAEPGDTNLPITASEGGGAAIVLGVEGIGIRAGSGAAVAFVYDTASEADSAASMLGVAASGTVVVVVDAAFPSVGASAVVECLGGEATPPEGGGAGGGTESAVSPESAACIAGRGFQLTEAGAPDLPITDADGEGLPVLNGVAGIGIRGATGAAVFYPFANEAEADIAMSSITGNPDFVLVGARVDAIAVDNVFIASDPGFPSDERFYLADCFD
jgi:hypothetical protein